MWILRRPFSSAFSNNLPTSVATILASILFKGIVEPFLRDIQGRRGIVDFRVVSDETVNTPAIVNQSKFRANIFIKPAVSLRRSTANKRFNISLGVGWNQLDKEIPGLLSEKETYFHFLPSVSYENSYKTGRRITFRYRSKRNW